MDFQFEMFTFLCNMLNGVTLPEWKILTADKSRWEVINTWAVVKSKIENEGDLKKKKIL